MRHTMTVLAAGMMIGTMSAASVSMAAFLSTPRMLELQPDRIRFDNPVLAPMGLIRFCLRYPDDCQAEKVDVRRHQIALTADRWNELNMINRQVNQDIMPDPDLGPAIEEWKISPPSGNCHDYAATKRHELLARGWPSWVLLFAEVVVPSGEHHLVLVVRTKDVDLVLDNLNSDIVPVAMTFGQYQWVRIETPQNPKYWARVRVPDDADTAIVSDGHAPDDKGTAMVFDGPAPDDVGTRLPSYANAKLSMAAARKPLAGVPTKRALLKARSSSNAAAPMSHCRTRQACRRPFVALTYDAATFANQPKIVETRAAPVARNWYGAGSSTAMSSQIPLASPRVQNTIHAIAKAARPGMMPRTTRLMKRNHTGSAESAAKPPATSNEKIARTTPSL